MCGLVQGFQGKCSDLVQMKPSDTKWIQWSQISFNEIKWAQVSPSETKWNQEKPSESRWNYVKPNDTKWAQVGNPVKSNECNWN